MHRLWLKEIGFPAISLNISSLPNDIENIGNLKIYLAKEPILSVEMRANSMIFTKHDQNEELANDILIADIKNDMSTPINIASRPVQRALDPKPGTSTSFLAGFFNRVKVLLLQ